MPTNYFSNLQLINLLLLLGISTKETKEMHLKYFQVFPIA